MDECSSFGHWLKQRRSELDLSRQELAAQAGCTVETIRKIEHNKRRPSKQLAQRLLRLLDVSQDNHRRLLHLARTLSDPEPDQNPTHHTEPPPYNLPMSTTPLIGRDNEVAQGVSLLLRDDVQLVTLSGAPGVGKTRLALQIAQNLYPSFQKDIYFISLAALADPQLLATTILQTLSITEIPNQNPVTRLIARLYNRTMLLVLDNFEHLIEGKQLVNDILTQTSRVKILITSRIVLRLSGEYEFPVQPFPIPQVSRGTTLELLRQNPSMDLFTTRARSIHPNFRLTEMNVAAVAEICTHLDGVPLAIELAAARSKILTPHELLTRLKQHSHTKQGMLHVLTSGTADLPLRQRTLRNTIAWSYHLLDPDTQAIFARLGVFQGSYTLDAIEAVCTIQDDKSCYHSSIPDLVATLLDSSLLIQVGNNPTQMRFRMLETIREFALEELRIRREIDTIQHQHAQYYVQLTEIIHPHLTEQQQSSYLDKLHTEYSNICAALDWALEQKHSNIAWRFGSVLWRFWMMRGHIYEGRQRLEQIRNIDGPVPDQIRALLLNGAAGLALLQQDYVRTQTLLEEALVLRQQNNDLQGVASIITNLGSTALELGEYAKARMLLEDAVQRWYALNMLGGVAYTLSSLGIVAMEQEDYRQAQSQFAHALSIAQELGQPSIVARTLLYLGVLTYDTGNLAQSFEYIIEGLDVWETSGNTSEIVEHLDVMAYMLTRAPYPYEIAQLCGAIQSLRDETGIARRGRDRDRFTIVTNTIYEYLTHTMFVAAWEAGNTMSFAQTIQLARELTTAYMKQVIEVPLTLEVHS